MKIAFLHYHLKTGGVTTVIKRQVMALKGKCQTLVLTGDRAETQLACQVVEIPELGYDRIGLEPPTADVTAEQILNAISQVWPGGCDVLHIHNPTLAKNRHLIECIRLLQSSGITLFLQIHDFAEDGRPEAYTRDAYPADCHYGVINARDARILVSAGLEPPGVHLVPNATLSLPVQQGAAVESGVVYPVRAIRRKNIGEAVLLSLYMRPDHTLHISQAPNSPGDMTVYQDWQAFVKKKGLNVRFESGRQYGFPALVGAATSMLTTSITEGFGFSFLEPWTAGKMLWGRRLGDICQDFEKKGLRLNSLYDRLAVPLGWLDADDFMQAWRRAAARVSETYGCGFAPREISQYLHTLARDRVVDFGILNEKYQRQVLCHLLSKPEEKQLLAALNPGISEPAPGAEALAMIENNRSTVLENYDLATYEDRLLAVYDRVIQQPVRHQIDKPTLLDAFLDVNRFSLLKWGTYEA